MKIFITAIGTDCGKTLVSAIFCQYLKADYWKPIQTGQILDSIEIKNLVSDPLRIYPETHLYNNPVSPHFAAEQENRHIALTDFRLPKTESNLIIEGAGGLLVPLNGNGDFLLDFISKENIEIVLVIRLYLGCINHALLSINELKRRKLSIKGLVFNGNDTFGAIDIITKITQLATLLIIKEEPIINPETIVSYSQKLNFNEQ